MKVKIIKGIYWGISVLLLVFGIAVKLNFQHSSFNFLYCFSLAVVANPFIMGVLLKKNLMDETKYIIGLKMMLCILGTIIAFVIAFVIFYKTGFIYKDKIEENFEAFLKISMFVVYLIIIYLCASENKCINYIVFGFFYCMFVVPSFFSVDITDEYIKLLNIISENSMNRESYKILVEDYFVPIREAILTYIIFDTVIECKKKSKIEKKKDADRQDTVNTDYFPV